MVEILKSFELVASRFSPAVLMVPGLAMVVLGLVAWLGGMCVRRLVLALLGAAAGGIAAVLIHGRNPAVAGLAAGGGALFRRAPAAACPRPSFWLPWAWRWLWSS